MDIKLITKKTSDTIRAYTWNEKVKRIGVFGSVARGESRKNSDIDLVVDYLYNYDVSGDALFEEANKKIQLDEMLRTIFSPIELSIVDTDTIEYEEHKDLKSAVYRDVVWIYEK